MTNPDHFDAACLVIALCERLRQVYIDPQAAEQICRYLQERLEAGEYRSAGEGEMLALALTIDLQETNHDEHLWVQWHAEPLPEDDEQLRLNEQWQALQREQARLENYGVYAVARLPGEVGLLDLRYLHRPEWGGETLGKAMDFLAEQRALILDLRHCTGGYPGMVALLCSYLFGETPIHLSSIYWQDDHTTQEFWTQAELPYRRFTGQAVFLLTSRETFSAGEMLAQLLQSFGRARLVGEKTDGGAHPGVSYRLAPHFEAFIPVGRAFDPRSGQDWEGKGVTPEIRLPAAEALGEAYRMAVEEGKFGTRKRERSERRERGRGVEA